MIAISRFETLRRASLQFESLLEELTAAAKSASFSVKRESPAAAAPAGQELATPTAAQEPAQPSTICCICFDQPTVQHDRFLVAVPGAHRLCSTSHGARNKP